VTERAERPLSKSKYLTGLRCHRLLWFSVHEPDAPEFTPDAEARFRMSQGDEVEREARVRLGPGVLIASPDFALDQRLRETNDALRGTAALTYEATFVAAGAVVSADVLRRTDSTFELIEVKSSTSVKPEQISDVALQLYVLRQAGLTVTRASVMHLNKECRYPDLSQLFVTVDVTAEAEAQLSATANELAAQRAAVRGERPDIPFGAYCRKPEPCAFFGRCWPSLPVHHVSTLYQIRWASVEKHLAAGRERVDQLDELSTKIEAAQRQIRSVRRRARIVEPGLSAALGTLVPPVAWLDFETISLAIPRWPGCAPWEHVPVQFSVHWSGAADNTTRFWLAEGGGDPRPPLAAALVQACAGASVVVAYYMQFEKQCLEHLAGAVPEHSEALLEIRDKLVDLLPIVRNHVYDPAFLGSFSLKKVLPAMLPELSYDDLEVRDGGTAMSLLAQLVLDPAATGAAAAQQRLRANLLAYCERDTLAMLRLAEALRAIAR
jgi:predicted RecB family nuclease